MFLPDAVILSDNSLSRMRVLCIVFDLQTRRFAWKGTGYTIPVTAECGNASLLNSGIAYPFPLFWNLES